MELSGQRHAPGALPPGKDPPVSIVQESRWAPEPVWTQVRVYISPFTAPAENRTTVVQTVA